jgi:hypothetical protein
MRNVTRALVGALVASLVAAAVSVYAQTPTAADFAVCNADAQAAMKAGTATPTTKDYVRVESARTDSAVTWTMWVGPIRLESSDPPLLGWRRMGSRTLHIRRHIARACDGMDSEKTRA